MRATCRDFLQLVDYVYEMGPDSYACGKRVVALGLKKLGDAIAYPQYRFRPDWSLNWSYNSAASLSKLYLSLMEEASLLRVFNATSTL